MVWHFHPPVCFYNGGEDVLYSNKTAALQSGLAYMHHSLVQKICCLSVASKKPWEKV